MESYTTPARRIIIKKHKLKKQNEINQNDNNKWYLYRYIEHIITRTVLIYNIHEKHNDNKKKNVNAPHEKLYNSCTLCLNTHKMKLKIQTCIKTMSDWTGK